MSNDNEYELFVLDLDLGQMQDCTALAVVERADINVPDSDGSVTMEKRLHLRHLERYSIGTFNPQVVEKVAKLMAARNSTAIVS